jgi:hypothetical protein
MTRKPQKPPQPMSRKAREGHAGMKKMAEIMQGKVAKTQSMKESNKHKAKKF